MNLQPFHTRPLVPPVVSRWRLLGDIEALLSEVPAETYRARLAPPVSASVGEHVWHCLDHVSALLAADPSTPLSYDRRHRGPTVEIDPTEALRPIFQLTSGLDAWTTQSLDDPIRVTSMIAASGKTVTGWSPLARELAFVVSHMIHHQAIIALLLAVHGYPVPERFGRWPSTPQRH